MVFLVRRVALGLLTLTALSLVVFALIGATPGRPTDEFALDGTLSAAARRRSDDLAAQPWAARYAAWCAQAVRGELGESRTYGRPVLALVRERAANTMLLAMAALSLAWGLALPLGMWVSTRRGGIVDKVVMLASSAVASTPEILLGLVVLWCAVRTGAFTTLATSADPLIAPWRQPVDAWPALRLPLLLVALVQLPGLLRQVRVTAADAAALPFVRLIRARGVPPRRVMWSHVSRVVAPTLVTLVGNSCTAAFSGALVAEVVFSWPGLGALLVGAAQARDEALLAGVVLTLATGLMIINFLADVGARAVDPRAQAHPW